MRRTEEAILLLGVAGSLMVGLAWLTLELGCKTAGRWLEKRRSKKRETGQQRLV